VILSIPRDTLSSFIIRLHIKDRRLLPSCHHKIDALQDKEQLQGEKAKATHFTSTTLQQNKNFSQDDV
jgi:hypothetical protein